MLVRSWASTSLVIPRERVRIATVTRGAFVRDIAAQGTVVVANSPTLFSSAVGTVTFAVKGRLRLADKLPPGVRQNQRVSVRIVLDRRDSALKVERGAFVDAGSYAYVVDGDTARRTPVQFGVMSMGEVEILSGLKEGDAVVVSSVEDFAGALAARLAN